MTRRVVIGADEAGATRVLADDTVAPVTSTALPGVEIFRLWEIDEASLPVTSTEHGDLKAVYYPSPPGVRFGVLSIPSGITYGPDPEADPEAAGAELEAALPGAAEVFDPEHAGVHVTDTVDFIAVLSGRGIVRGGQVEVRLGPGDCLVQNGMPHAWFNDGTEAFVVAFAICGAHRVQTP